VIYGIRDQAAASFPNLTNSCSRGFCCRCNHIHDCHRNGKHGHQLRWVCCEGQRRQPDVGSGSRHDGRSDGVSADPSGRHQTAYGCWGQHRGLVCRLAILSRLSVFGTTHQAQPSIWMARGRLLRHLPANLTLVLPFSGQRTLTPSNTTQTSIDAASNGLALPQGTITVLSTTGYPASGTFWVQTTNGPQLITYTGTTGTTFTGCTGGTGTLLTGQSVIWRYCLWWRRN
jgi:hypothetical protein